MENAYDRRSPEWASYVTVPDENNVSQPVVPGLWCPTDGIDDAKLDESSFSFTYCKAAQVGGTYEFHWVFSTGGPGKLQEDGSEGELGITAGLGGAFTRTNNAICLIVNDPSLNDYVDAQNRTFLEQWQQPPAGSAVRYVGSTTGPSYDDEVCSPVEVNWHVDQRCCILSAQAMDNLCKDMIDAGLEADVSPKGSRRPVDRRWVSDVPPPSQTFFHGHRVSHVSRHVRRTSRGDLPAGPAGCRHRAAALGAAASEDGMQTALQTCGVCDGPANLGDGPDLLEPARRTVHFCWMAL
ncbi:unnamed protein product [Symbiodinium sp. CCMP2592]|nr:unnamed protein product [Symbiodinium sp. CCMP2592]